MVLILASGMISEARENRPIVINNLKDYNYYYSKDRILRDGCTISTGHYEIMANNKKISAKYIENDNPLKRICILSSFGSNDYGLPATGNHHAIFSSLGTFNVYLHPDNKLNRYVTIEIFDNNKKKYIINAYGAAFGNSVAIFSDNGGIARNGKTYGKEVAIIYCNPPPLLYRTLPKWIYDKYDKEKHFDDCTKPLNFDDYINLKENKKIDD